MRGARGARRVLGLKPPRGLSIGEVEASEDGLWSSPLDDGSGHQLSGVLARTVVKPHSKPALGQSNCRRSSDPSTRSGDQGLFHGYRCSSRRI